MRDRRDTHVRDELVALLDGSAIEQSLARAGDGVCVVGSEGRIMLWNAAAEGLLGYAARDVVGQSCCEVFAGRDGHGNLLCHDACHVKSLVRLDEPVRHFEMCARHRAGQSVWLDVSVLTVSNVRGPLTIHLFRDVTATRELLTLVRERRAADATDGAPLTRREIEVLRLLATGLDTRATAERLHVSRATVRNHVQNLLGKIGAHNRLEAVAYAHRHRLV